MFGLGKITTFLIILGTLIGCRKGPSSRGECAGAQSLLSSGDAVMSVEAPSPVGGFLHIGNRSCTATFLLEQSGNNSLRFSAYTAQHCINEDSGASERFAVSIYLEDGAKRGYTRKLPVSDDFFSRRSAFLGAVRQLNSAEALELATEATRIPNFGDRGFDQIRNDDGSVEGGRETSEIENKNVCLSNRTDLLNVSDSEHLCWSTLDTTVRRLTLNASDLERADFEAVKRHFEQRKAAIDSLMRNSPQISKNYTAWSLRSHGQVGGWRLTQYASLAAFLNNELCGKYLPKDDRYQSVCAVREQLIKLVDVHLKEVDTDGQLKTVFQHADQLGMGLTSPFLTTRNEPLKSALPNKSRDQFLQFLNKKTEELSRLFPKVNGEKIRPLPKQFGIAANSRVSSQNKGESELMFGLIKSDALFSGQEPLPSPGVNAAGLLRMYVAKKNIQVQFGPTDSGAMLTFSGIVPLLVLNAVNDKPTSGGSAILALPEIAYDDDVGVAQGDTSAEGQQNVALGNSVNSKEALVQYGNSPCY